MGSKTKIDSAGRIVVPKELRDRYGMGPGSEVEIVPLPDGISVIPSRREHRIVHRGRVTAIDTGAGIADLEAFDPEEIRREHFERKSGYSW